MDDEGRKAQRQPVGDRPKGASGSWLREPVAALLEDREVGLVPDHHTAALRHQVVPDMGFRSPARGASYEPSLPAQDAWLDEDLGWLEGRRGGKPEENIETSASEGLVGNREKEMATTAAPLRTMTSTFPLKYFISALAITWTFWWLVLIVAHVIFSHGRW